MKTNKSEQNQTNYVFQEHNQVYLQTTENNETKGYYPINFNWIPTRNSCKIWVGYSLFLLSCLLTLISCDKNDETYVGSQNLVSEIREVREFTRLKSTGVFDVIITQGAEQSVEITADDNIIGKVRTKVVDGELRLELPNDTFRNISLKAVINVKELTEIKNSGVGNIVASNIDTEQSFSVSNSGDADIILIGNANKLTCINEGAGSVLGFGFWVNKASLENIGAGSIETGCIETLDVKISGSGNVYYKGNPSVNFSTTGSGSVIKVED